MLYLLHFDPAFKHAQHYFGYSEYFHQRIEHHLAGSGSRLVRAAIKAGCKITLVRIFYGDGNSESDIKRSKNSKILCPLCTPTAMNNMKVYRSSPYNIPLYHNERLNFHLPMTYEYVNPF